MDRRVLRQQHDSFSVLASCARLVAIAILTCPAALGQSQGLSIANYRVVSQQTIQGKLNVTYRVDLVNHGAALEGVTATVTSLNAAGVEVAAGQSTLQFARVPANSQVTSSHTFTVQFANSLAVDPSQLQWTFQAPGILLPANITVAPGDTANFPVALGTAAPAGGVFLTLSSSNPSIAAVSPSTLFVAEGMTTAPRASTTVTGFNAGSVTVTASAPGYASASAQVQVGSGGTPGTTMSFWPSSLTVNVNSTQNLTLNLSAPASAALTANVSSSDATVATVPATVTFAAGTASASVPVTGVAPGSVSVTASAPNIAGATASVTVTQSAPAGGILVPTNITVAPGDTVSFPVALGTAAPSGGVFITLASNNPSVATVSPSTVFVAEGMTTAPRAATAVTAYNAGSATIAASAPGYAAATSQVQVTGVTPPSLTLSFSPASLTINGNATQNLTLNLSAAAPAALTVSLNSSDVTVATVPASVTFGAGAASVSVPVTGVAPGSVSITASAPNVAGASATVTVTQPAGGGILIPASVTVAAGNTVSFPVALGTAAPAGGVYITLATSNPSVATASPSYFFIPQGMTSNTRVATTVNGISNGSATVTASAFGYPTATSQVQVNGVPPPPLTMSFAPASLTINTGATQNLTLSLSAVAPSALTVSLGSSDVTVATVPATVTFTAGTASVSVAVTGVAPGLVLVTASAPGITSTTATVTVTQAASARITLPASATVGLNQSVTLPVTLSAPAPAGGVTVSLTSSDSSTVTVTPSVFIAASASVPATQPQISGVKPGSASITASAPGFAPGSSLVQVSASGGGSFFSPVGGVTINAGTTQNLTLNLSPPPASDLTVSLSSSNAGVATVPATVLCAAGSGTVTVPVTGVAAGAVTITASTPGYGTATSNVTVISLDGVSVTWYGACWATLTINGYTGNFQAIDFSLVTPTPVVVNGSLFFTSNCDPSQGVDNMNDTGALTGTTHMIQGFLRHPDVIPSSAMYWIGNASTVDGTCPKGSLCSGCLAYTAATPNCSTLP